MFSVTASSASTPLQFEFMQTLSFSLLDDVSVTPASIPDAGSTFPLLGFALLSFATLGRRLGCSEVEAREACSVHAHVWSVGFRTITRARAMVVTEATQRLRRTGVAWSMLVAGNGIATSLGTRWLYCHGLERDPPNAIEHSVQVRAAHSRGQVARDPQVCGSVPRGLPLDR
jgi:hypothetical protein